MFTYLSLEAFPASSSLKYIEWIFQDLVEFCHMWYIYDSSAAMILFRFSSFHFILFLGPGGSDPESELEDSDQEPVPGIKHAALRDKAQPPQNFIALLSFKTLLIRSCVRPWEIVCLPTVAARPSNRGCACLRSSRGFTVGILPVIGEPVFHTWLLCFSIF